MRNRGIKAFLELGLLTKERLVLAGRGEECEAVMEWLVWVMSYDKCLLIDSSDDEVR